MNAQPPTRSPRHPRLVAFEVTSRCNLACVMCPHGVGAVADPADAPEHLLARLWPTMLAAETVHLNGVGEPLLADIFWTIVHRLEGRARPHIDFNTNGLLLTMERLRQLARAPLGRVYISIDAASAGTYRRIRGGSFEKVMAAAARAAHVLGQACDLGATFVIMRENIAEVVPFVALMAETGIPSVNFSVLTEPGLGTTTWQVRRDDCWHFDYRDQMIARDDPALLESLHEAVAHGCTSGVRVACTDIPGWVS